MTFTYKNQDYEMFELTEPNKNETFDIIAVARIAYCIWKGTDLVEVDKKTYEETEDNFEDYKFIGYFYGADGSDEELIRMAQETIDRREE